MENVFTTIKMAFCVKVYADEELKKIVRELWFDTWDELNRGMAGETLPYIISIEAVKKEA